MVGDEVDGALNVIRAVPHTAQGELFAHCNAQIEHHAVGKGTAEDGIAPPRADAEGDGAVVAVRTCHVHGARGKPSARDACNAVEQVIARDNGVIYAAAARKVEREGISVDENGCRLLVDEELANENAEEIGAHNGNVLSLLCAEAVDCRPRKSHIVHQKSVFIGHRVGEQRHFVRRYEHKISHEAILCLPADSEVVLGKIALGGAFVLGAEEGVEQHPRSLVEVVMTLVPNDAHGISSRHKGVFCVDLAAEDGGIGSAEKQFCNADADLSLFRRGNGLILPFEHFRPGKFPDIHRRAPFVNFCVLYGYYTAREWILQAFRRQNPNYGLLPCPPSRVWEGRGGGKRKNSRARYNIFRLPMKIS